MTRTVLRILGSRYGIAAVLLLLVIVVVGLARAYGGADSSTSVDGSDSAGPTKEGEPDDGVATSAGEQSETAEAKLPAEAVTVATNFAENYIDTDRSAKKWRAALGRYATQKVKDELTVIDPDIVPTKEIQDKAIVKDDSVEFPTNAGLLILLMTEQNGGWLVNGIDNDNT